MSKQAGVRLMVDKGLHRKALPSAHGYGGTPLRTLSEAYGSTLRERSAVKRSERVPFMEWALRIPEPKAGRLNFEDFPFQVELYEQGAHDKEAVVKKGTQVGISAYLVRWAMYWPDVRGATGLYVFPKLKGMYDFSDSRVRASIQKSEYLQGRIPPAHVQNKGLKQIGFGFLYFRGSESEDDLDSVDADVLALDEYDRLYQPNIPVAERRISGPTSLALMRRVGVPTIPGFGISRLYEASDKRRWFVRCEFCAEWQYLTWERNVDTEAEQRICAECRKALSPEVIRRGEWVAEHPEREVRGYHLPKLIVPRLNMHTMVENSRKTLPEDVQAFWNRDLAEAYAPAEGRLTEEAIAAAMSSGAASGSTARGPGYVGNNLITMGVDVASSRNLNVRISEHFPDERRRALFVGEVSNFDELALMMDRYRVAMCGIDHMPERRLAMAFAEKFAGRVYLISYATREQADVLKVDDPHRFASVRRVEAIDATFEQVRRQVNMLPPDAPRAYGEHLQAPIRIVERNDKGQTVVRYESTGADDYAHAEVYDLVAAQLWWLRQQVTENSNAFTSRIEDHMEFQRSALHEEEARYVEGPAYTGVEG